MLAHLPVWVFFVFALLLLLGLRQSRPRTVKPAATTGIALAMLGLSLSGVISAFGAHVLPLCAWAIGTGLTVTLGGRALDPRPAAAAQGRVQLPGSWLPMVLMMSIFAIKFMLGYAQGMGTDLIRQSGVVGLVSLALGALSGAFSARALAVRRFAYRQRQTVTAA